MKNLLIIIQIVMLSSCNLTQTEKTISIPPKTLDSILLKITTENTTLSVVTIEDLSRSRKAFPQLLEKDYSSLESFCKSHVGRERIGYTTVTENSFTPIINFTFLTGPQEPSSLNNMWIEKNVIDFYTTKKLIKIIDSLNSFQIQAFRDSVKFRQKRPSAYRSDVVQSIKRAVIFLNESSDATKVIILGSDVIDTFHSTISLEPDIQLYIVGAVLPGTIKQVLGRTKETYLVFDSYASAYNRIIQTYNN